MTTTAVQPSTSESAPPSWRMDTPPVRQALTFIQEKGEITASDLVEWDRTHGRRLFNWDDDAAANEWRIQEARTFLNRFRKVIDGKRVRAFIHIEEDSAVGIERSAYYSVEQIAAHPGMRAQVIDDITKRLKSLASELRMWKLSPEEQAAIFAKLAEAMSDFAGGAA